MPLLALWSSNPSTIGQFTVEQIVATAGSGDLRDNSDCAEELREYLSQVTSQKLAEYIDRCLITHFSKSGSVLQGLINELGRRLDYKVTNGRYQGTVNSIGYDGIWLSPEGQAVVVEVKTTDAYRISLNAIARYRDRLLYSGQISSPSSSLIVVGREDTGELEAQVRGSRHAWDMRLISADALIKLVQLKENAEGPETGSKIRSLLVPREFMRLDEMVDVMFTTAKDVERIVEAAEAEEEPATDVGIDLGRIKGTWEFTDSSVLQAKRDEIIVALSRREGTPLIKKSRALYWSPDHDKRAAFTISKHYARRNGPHYWYAYHTQWDEFLKAGGGGYFVLGCMDRNQAFAIPIDVFRPLMEDLNTTRNEDGTYYWHIQLTETPSGDVSLIVPKRKSHLQLLEYRLKLEPSSPGTT
jgi:hypothetical protein